MSANNIHQGAKSNNNITTNNDLFPHHPASGSSIWDSEGQAGGNFVHGAPVLSAGGTLLGESTGLLHKKENVFGVSDSHQDPVYDPAITIGAATAVAVTSQQGREIQPQNMRDWVAGKAILESRPEELDFASPDAIMIHHPEPYLTTEGKFAQEQHQKYFQEELSKPEQQQTEQQQQQQPTQQAQSAAEVVVPEQRPVQVPPMEIRQPTQLEIFDMKRNELLQAKNKHSKLHLQMLSEAEAQRNSYSKADHPPVATLPSPDVELESESTKVDEVEKTQLAIDDAVEKRKKRQKLDRETRRYEERTQDGAELKPRIQHPEAPTLPDGANSMTRSEERLIRQCLVKASKDNQELCDLLFGTLAAGDPDYHAFMLQKILAKKNEVTHALPLARDLEEQSQGGEEKRETQQVKQKQLTATHLKDTKSLDRFTKGLNEKRVCGLAQ